MTHLVKVGEGVNVAPILAEIDAHPELWDAVSMRRVEEATPHAGMTDIWVRANDISKFPAPFDRAAFNAPHHPIFYPAWRLIPSLKPVVFGLMAGFQAVHLGAIYITKVPPGGKILPHRDGAWHAEFHNAKVYVPLKSNEGCVNTCEDERVTMRAGEVWTFDNLRIHSVENNGDDERVTLIVCMRVEG